MPTGRAALLCAVLFAAPAAAQTPAAEHFEKKVRPLLLQHCGGCHGADGKKVKGGLKLLTKADLLAGGESGPVVVPGESDKSLLVQTVRYDGDLKMPPKGKLKPHEIAAVEEWVKGGAVWPGAEVGGAEPHRSQGPLFTEEQKKFWAFQPVTNPTPPAVKDAKWVSSPVDAFLLARLEAKELKPAAAAYKRALLRRATFDLTGLPPTPDELDAFLADRSPDAFARVVDRLLASPAYGERWGRHWLDVARYADSNGLDENTAFGNAWKYRDYVIRSFNADKPFDTFVKEQIAGDLLPPTDDVREQADRLTALGYLVLGPKLLAEPDKQKMLIDIADEQLDTIGKGLMGLTLGCARCHDHKFDPLPTRDYYSLLGVFTGTRTMQGLGTVAKAFERPLPTASPEAVATAKEVEKKLFAKTREVRLAQDKVRKEADEAKKKPLQEAVKKLQAEEADLRKRMPAVDTVLAVEDGTAGAYGTQPRNLYVQVRGNYVTPGEEAPPVFLRIIAGEAQTPFVPVKPNPTDKSEPSKTRFGQFRDRSGRLELANWVTDAKHPLTARVWVNRVWQHHFGEGLVRSPDNFGRLGELPTHPELLDFLASRLIADGWSVKKLHRLVMLSSAYRMSTASNDKAALADPDNRLLWHYPRRRLEAEAIRDAMLAAAGTLDPTVGGSLLTTGNFEYVTNDQSKSAARYDSVRRSIYLPVVRNNVFPFFQTFDFPDPSVMNGKRVSTVVAPQALYLMNSAFVTRQAEAFAGRLLKAEADDAARVRLAYRLAYGREPTKDETTRALKFVASYEAAAGEVEKEPTRRRLLAWQALGQAVFAGNEFVYLN